MRVLLVVRTVQFEPSFVQSILCVRTTRPAQTKTVGKKNGEFPSLPVLGCLPSIFGASGSTLCSRPVYPTLAQTVLACLHRSQSI